MIGRCGETVARRDEAVTETQADDASDAASANAAPACLEVCDSNLPPTAPYAAAARPRCQKPGAGVSGIGLRKVTFSMFQPLMIAIA